MQTHLFPSLAFRVFESSNSLFSPSPPSSGSSLLLDFRIFGGLSSGPLRRDCFYHRLCHRLRDVLGDENLVVTTSEIINQSQNHR